MRVADLTAGKLRQRMRRPSNADIAAGSEALVIKGIALSVRFIISGERGSCIAP